MTARHFGLTSGLRPGGIGHEGRSHLAHGTQRDLNSSYRVPSQSILHREDIPDPPLDRSALGFVTMFLIAVAGICIGLYFFLRAIGL